MVYRLVTGLSRWQKSTVLLGLDGLAIVLAFALVVLGSDHGARAYAPHLIAGLSVGLWLGCHLDLHRMKLTAYEMQGVTDTLLVAAGVATAAGLANLVQMPGQPPQIMGARDLLILAAAVSALSILARLALLRATRAIYAAEPKRLNILIFGAGLTARQLVGALGDGDLRIAAIVDENPHLHHHSICGLPIYAPSRMAQLIAAHRIDRIVLALDSPSPSEEARLLRQFAPLGVPVLTLPSLARLIGRGPEDVADARPLGRAKPRGLSLDLHDLLGRNPLEIELPGVGDSYRRRNIMITGAGGSIGSEICHQLARCAPARLILVDHSELALFTIHRDLTTAFPDLPIEQVLGSVADRDLMSDIIAQYQVDDVLHAAAYKHLPLVQCNPIAGLRNNVLATRSLAEVARQHGVDRFILISSDKALRPSSVMGVTKRMAEQIIQDMAARQGTTRFAIVRFGNVIGSSGSVVQIFEDQIARGGPITVTDPEATRYFMTISEAVRLVLMAGSFARGGDIFALDMGAPVPVIGIAQHMIETAGFTPVFPGSADAQGQETPRQKGDLGADRPKDRLEIKILFTGLRDGEKRDEERMIGSDMLTTPHPKILRANDPHLSELGTARALAELREAVDTRDADRAIACLRKWAMAPQGTGRMDEPQPEVGH